MVEGPSGGGTDLQFTLWQFSDCVYGHHLFAIYRFPNKHLKGDVKLRYLGMSWH